VTRGIVVKLPHS
jgi:hypothetical protein